MKFSKNILNYFSQFRIVKEKSLKVSQKSDGEEINN